VSQEWFFKSMSAELGPYTPAEMKRFAEMGRIDPDTLVRKGREGKWVAAERVKGLFAQVANRPQAPPSVAPKTPSPSPTTPPPSVIVRQSPPRVPDPPKAASIRLSQGKLLAIIGSGVGGVALVVILVLFMLSGGEEAGPTDAVGGGTTATNPSDGTESPDNRPTRLTTEQVVAQAEPSVAFIKGRFSSGTGFIVRPGIVATNKHVIAAELIDHIKVHFPSATAAERGPFSAQLLYKDPERDLAFLSVGTSLPALKVAPQHSFRRGQQVIVIGNPGVGEELVLQNAISQGVMSTRAEIKGQEYYQLGISINSGNSGGPVLDTSGQVIGVVTLKASEQEGLGFCIPLPQLNAAVAALDKLSSQEIAAIRSQHRLRVVFTFVTVTGELYKTGMQAYTSAMEFALNKGVSVNIGLQAVRGEVEGKLSAYDQVLIGDLKQEVSRITTDPNIPEATRQRFVDLWTNYLELKSYVDEPRGNFDTYKAKYNELSDNHDRLSQSLKLLLGIDVSE